MIASSSYNFALKIFPASQLSKELLKIKGAKLEF